MGRRDVQARRSMYRGCREFELPRREGWSVLVKTYATEEDTILSCLDWKYADNLEFYCFKKFYFARFIWRVWKYFLRFQLFWRYWARFFIIILVDQLQFACEINVSISAHSEVTKPLCPVFLLLIPMPSANISVHIVHSENRYISYHDCSSLAETHDGSIRK